MDDYHDYPLIVCVPYRYDQRLMRLIALVHPEYEYIAPVHPITLDYLLGRTPVVILPVSMILHSNF